MPLELTDDIRTTDPLWGDHTADRREQAAEQAERDFLKNEGRNLLTELLDVQSDAGALEFVRTWREVFDGYASK